MGAIPRKYPRLPFHEPGELDVRVFREGTGRSERVRIPVTIRSISCEGVGLAIRGEQPAELNRGASITLHFAAGGDEFEIPGRIAWYARDGKAAPFDLGVRFQLELAKHTTRRAYAQWIVKRIQEAQRRVPRARGR